jgi:hypothetical protein
MGSDVAFFVSLIRGATAVLILSALLWLACGFVQRFTQGRALAEAPSGSGGDGRLPRFP